MEINLKSSAVPELFRKLFFCFLFLFLLYDIYLHKVSEFPFLE